MTELRHGSASREIGHDAGPAPGSAQPVGRPVIPATSPVSLARPAGPDAASEWSRNWPVVLACGAGVALSTTHIYSLGVVMAPLHAQFGWSRAQISSGMTVGSLVAVLTSPFIGLLVDRVGPRRVALAGAVIYCAMVALLSQAGPSIWSWLAIWFGIAIGISGITPTIWTYAISGLFVRGRGLALSASLCGTGVGSSVTPIVTSYLSDHYGWRAAYLGLAGFWAMLVLPILFVLFTSVQDRDRVSTPVASRTPVALSGLTSRSGFRSARFYKLALASAAIAMVAVSFAVNMVPILASQGFSRSQAASIAGVIGIASIVGRLSAGYLNDRLNGNLVAAVSVSLPILSSAILLAFPGAVVPSLAATAILGLALGSELDSVAYLATRHLGMRSFGVLFGTISGLLSLATGLGPLVVSYVFDVTGSYTLVLWAYIPLCALSAIMFLSLGRYPAYASSPPPSP